MEHGDYALRGSLIDVYPMGAERPFRIDLFDEENREHSVFRAGVAALRGQYRPYSLAAGQGVLRCPKRR